MAPQVFTTGVILPVLGTEHVVMTAGAANTYVTKVCAANMLAGDFVEIKVYDKVHSSLDALTAYRGSYNNQQADPVKLAIPVPAALAYKVGLHQYSGTPRTFAWTVLII